MKAAQIKTKKRIAAFSFGLTSETRAAWLLRCKGYRVLARRAKHPVGEIDLIAKRGKFLAFVEVKARRSVGEAIHAISPNQRRRIERAAEAFVAHRPDLAACDWRFDVVILEGRWGWPRHIADAWRPGDSEY
jgi:putative endonuclease